MGEAKAHRIMTPEIESILEELRILRAKSAEMEQLYQETIEQEYAQFNNNSNGRLWRLLGRW